MEFTADMYAEEKAIAECQICHRDSARYLVLGQPVCNECNTKSPLDNLGNAKKAATS